MHDDDAINHAIDNLTGKNATKQIHYLRLKITQESAVTCLGRFTRFFKRLFIIEFNLGFVQVVLTLPSLDRNDFTF